MVKLTAKEEEILNYFWLHGPLFVKDLLKFQNDHKPHDNTLSTIVRSLEEKGYLGYNAFGNTHQYFAIVSEKEYGKSSIKKLINRYYNNSYKNVVSMLIEEENISEDELIVLINKIRNKQ